MNIRGLCLVHRQSSSVTVHWIDGMALGVGPHEARMYVPLSVIDPSSTVARPVDPDDASQCEIDVTGKDVTIPGASNQGGAPDLTFDDGPIDSNFPADDAHWKPLKFAAQLSTLCHATMIMDTSKFSGSVQIDHGHLECAKPSFAEGARTKWTFTDPGTGAQVTPPQVLSDTLACHVDLKSSSPSMMIGNQTLVFKSGLSPVVLIRNWPTQKHMCNNGAQICVDHLEQIYNLVDAQIKPNAVGVITGGTGPGVIPDYCPPPMI